MSKALKKQPEQEVSTKNSNEIRIIKCVYLKAIINGKHVVFTKYYWKYSLNIKKGEREMLSQKRLTSCRGSWKLYWR